MPATRLTGLQRTPTAVQDSLYRHFIIAISSKFRSHTCVDCDLRHVEGNGLADLGALYRSHGHMFWMHNLLRVDIEVARDLQRLVASVRSGRATSS